MTELTKDEVTEFALSAMLEHDLHGVEFSWTNDKSYMGIAQCKKIDGKWVPQKWHLSEPIFNGLSDKWEIVDTIYHEIAHLISYRDYGDAGGNHGPVWKMVARRLGARPKSCGDGVTIDYDAAGFKYVGYCPSCDYEQGFSKMGRIWKCNWNAVPNLGYYCPKCHPQLYLKIRRNY